MEKKITHREFVQATAAASAAVAITPMAGCTDLTTRYDPKGLPTSILGKTGVEVPRLGFDCGSRWMAVKDNDEALGILEYAHDHGVYYWDTAPTDGNDQISSEEREC